MQKEGPMVTFSESLSFFQKVQVSEINNITRHNMNKQFVALKEAQQNANQRYTYAIGPFCSQWQVSIFDPSHQYLNSLLRSFYERYSPETAVLRKNS